MLPIEVIKLNKLLLIMLRKLALKTSELIMVASESLMTFMVLMQNVNGMT